MELPRINDMIERTFGFVGRPKQWGSNMQFEVLLPVYHILAGLISIIIISLSIVIYSPWLCLIILIAPLPYVFTQINIGERIFRKNRENTSYFRKAQYFEDVLIKNAVKEVRTFGITDFIFSKWKEQVEKYFRNELKTQRQIQFIHMINTTVNNLIYIAVIIYVITLYANRQLTIGEFGATFSLVSVLLSSTTSLFTNIGNVVTKKYDCAQFFQLIDLKEQSTIPNKISNINSVEFINVSYRYPLADRYVLRDVSVKIQEGDFIALVGENGAGKSTFAKLLAGIISPSTGDIKVNGCSLSEFDVDSYYDTISTVSQDLVRYYTFTALENVKLGKLDQAANESVIRGALEFSGYNGPFNEVLGKDIGGIELSTGQWQKISIAKAYVKGRDFMILDEPTSNLDPIAEAEIFQKYLEMKNSKTVIIVTHRISLATFAKKIFVFKNGEIVEIGDHQSLMKINGEYGRLYNTQAQWYNR